MVTTEVWDSRKKDSVVGRTGVLMRKLFLQTRDQALTFTQESCSAVSSARDSGLSQGRGRSLCHGTERSDGPPAIVLTM